jgi:peptide/nickel transport system permease protein
MSGITRYIVQRLLIAVPELLCITVIVFLMQELMPGDFVDSLVRPEDRALYGPEGLQRLRQIYGLDQPAPIRYWKWLTNLLLHGNLGTSFSTGQPVLREMLRRLPATLELTVTSLIFGLVIGTTVGVVSAIKQYSLLDNLCTLIAFFWISTPGFVFALIAIYLFSFRLPIFPTGGMGPVDHPATLWDRLHYMFLPATILSLAHVAGIMRYARASFLDEMRQEYITVARAKGLASRAVYLRHVLRNAILPLITITTLSLPGLIGGAVLIETIFVWRGLGLYAYQAVTSNNYPVIMAVNLIAAVLVLLSNLLADIAYAWADPRIRYE